MMDTEDIENIKKMIKEDTWNGDVTSKSLIPEGTEAEAEVIAGEPGYLAGVPEAIAIFEELGVEVEVKKNDGEKFGEKDVLLEVRGPARGILASERVSLNLMSRMSGIATATRKMIERAEKSSKEVKIAATRKTAPLLRKFDKKAVEIVGGEPHRFNLSDFILIKDNHLKLVDSIRKAIRKARQAGLSDKIEIEVNNQEEAVTAAKAGADIVMLDNFGVQRAKKTVEKLEEEGLREGVMLEASGGISLSNVEEHAGTGVDIISSSYMTMKSRAIDLKLEILE